MSKSLSDILTLLSAVKSIEITTPEVTPEGIPEGSKFGVRFIPKEVENHQEIDELIELLQHLKLQKFDKTTQRKITACKRILSPKGKEKTSPKTSPKKRRGRKWSDEVIATIPREVEELKAMEKSGEIVKGEYNYGDEPPPLYFVGHTPRRPFRFQCKSGGHGTLIHGIDADGNDKNICICPKNKSKTPDFYFATDSSEEGSSDSSST